MKYQSAGPCEGPGCSQIVPAAEVSNRQKYRCCSRRCQRRKKDELASRHLIGSCRFCGSPILGRRHEKRLFCSWEHKCLYHSERMLEPTGSFRPIIEEYLSTVDRYRPSSLAGVKTSLTQFFGFAHSQKGLTTLDQIRPSTISEFIKSEKSRGIESLNLIGRISTFFKYMIVEEKEVDRNPVISGIHKRQQVRRAPRPLSTDATERLTEFVFATGDPAFKLAFSLGLECGLRGGETCNVRLEDVDRSKNEILVRLPTKNMLERSVPYHDLVASCLDEWLPLRQARCGHNYLLHGPRLARWTIWSLDKRFKDKLAHMEGAPSRFTYHRLRHTWATRLLNNGMDLAVLKELGGWLHWTSLQFYIQVLPETIRRQYQAAYERIDEVKHEEPDQLLTLADYLQVEN